MTNVAVSSHHKRPDLKSAQREPSFAELDVPDLRAVGRCLSRSEAGTSVRRSDLEGTLRSFTRRLGVPESFLGDFCSAFTEFLRSPQRRVGSKGRALEVTLREQGCYLSIEADMRRLACRFDALRVEQSRPTERKRLPEAVRLKVARALALAGAEYDVVDNDLRFAEIAAQSGISPATVGRCWRELRGAGEAMLRAIDVATKVTERAAHIVGLAGKVMGGPLSERQLRGEAFHIAAAAADSLSVDEVMMLARQLAAVLSTPRSRWHEPVDGQAISEHAVSWRF